MMHRPPLQIYRKSWTGRVGACCPGLMLSLALLFHPAGQAQERQLRFGVYNNAPKIFVDAKGQPAGILVELLREIAHEESWTLIPVMCEWESCLEELERGQIDLLPDVAFTEERAQRFDFHQVPVLNAWSQVFVRPGNKIESLLDLHDKRITVLSGSVQEAYLKETLKGFGISANFLPVNKLIDGFELVASGQSDAVVANNLYGGLHASEHHLVPTALVFQPTRLFYALTKGHNSDLLATLDRHLKAGKAEPDSYYYTVLRRWTGGATPSHVPVAFWWGLGAVLTALAMALAGTVWLRREVKRVTADLRQSRDELSTILDSVGAHVYIKDTESRYLYANRLTQEFFGHSLQEIRGRSDLDFYDAATAVRLREHDVKVFQGGQKLVKEEVTRANDGDGYRTYLAVKLPLRDASGAIYGLCGISTDLTEHRQIQQEMHSLAYFDPLTHLPNRRLLIDRLQQGLATYARTHRDGALLLLDLDNFSLLNSTLGHDAGDQLLQQISQRLAVPIRAEDTLARLSSDEFVVMLHDLSDDKGQAAEQVQIVARKLQQVFMEPFQLGAHRHTASASIGIAMFSDGGESVEEILQLADLALHQAKAEEAGSVRFFNQDMQVRAQWRADLEADLREALVKKEFYLEYQLQVDAHGRVLGAESLVRWQHPRLGKIMPAQFIPAAESSGLILPLGRWILETACKQLVSWQSHPATAHWIIGVNVSARQFRRDSFVDEVLEVLEQTGAKPALLELELTESQLLDNVNIVIAKMSVLRLRGVSFALDDFGTGYSSLAYLKQLPLHRLKIDKSFIDDLLTDPKDVAIVKTVVALAVNLGLEVIAEGVETAAQRDALQQIGEIQIQGYFYGRPVSAEAFESMALQFKAP